jgi:hypothetical protein
MNNEEPANTTPQKLLADFVRELGKGAGNVTVKAMPDPAAAIDELEAGAPGKALAVAFYESDSPDNDADVDGGCLVQARVSVAVAAHVGLKLAKDEAQSSALAFAEIVRRKALLQRGPFGAPRYAGMRYLSASGGRLLHGYIVSFDIAAAFGGEELGTGD